MSRVLYRSRQVMHGLRPRIDQDDLAFACALLSAAEARLFFSMERRDQRHGLEVARRLREAGEDEPVLLTAALLHDCGKGAVPLWLRVLWVLAPAIVRRVGRSSKPGWRGAAYRLAEHAQLGARLVEMAGAQPPAVRLIAGRPTAAEIDLLRALQAADDAS